MVIRTENTELNALMQVLYEDGETVQSEPGSFAVQLSKWEAVVIGEAIRVATLYILEYEFVTEDVLRVNNHFGLGVTKSHDIETVRQLLERIDTDGEAIRTAVACFDDLVARGIALRAELSLKEAGGDDAS